MGTPTGNLVYKIRTTSKGSDHYGGCELCNKHVSETFAYKQYKEFIRFDGTIYLSSIGRGAYGHRECLLENYVEHKSETA